MTDQIETVSLRAPEVRTYPVMQMRVVDGTEDGQYIEGRAVPYESWTDVGWYMEKFIKGAFSKSIREAAKQLPLLLWHDNRSFPVGVSEEWRDNDDGLDCVWRIDTSDELAVEAARKARDGYLTGLSVGFAPIMDLGKDGRDRNNIRDLDDNGVMWITRKQARLLEVSLTPTPAYAGAKVQLVRTRDRQARPSIEVGAWRRYLEGVNR